MPAPSGDSKVIKEAYGADEDAGIVATGQNCSMSRLHQGTVQTVDKQDTGELAAPLCLDKAVSPPGSFSTIVSQIFWARWPKTDSTLGPLPNYGHRSHLGSGRGLSFSLISGSFGLYILL